MHYRLGFLFCSLFQLLLTEAFRYQRRFRTLVPLSYHLKAPQSLGSLSDNRDTRISAPVVPHRSKRVPEVLRHTLNLICHFLTAAVTHLAIKEAVAEHRDGTAASTLSAVLRST